MIAQNKKNVLGGGGGGGREGELANKTDYRTVSYKHRTVRILVQIK